MNFYFLTNSTDTDVGCLPQIEEPAKSEYLFNALTDWDLKYKINNPQFESFKLSTKAKANDYLVAIPFNRSFTLFISEKFLDLLQEFKVDDHVVIPVKVIKKNKQLGKYYLLKYAKSAANFVNVKKSIFYLYNIKTQEKEKIEYSQSEFENLLNKELDPNFKYPHYLCAEKLVFKPIIDLDLFSLSELAVHSFVSEPLKNAIVKSNITGVDFKSIGEGPNWEKIEEIIIQ